LTIARPTASAPPSGDRANPTSAPLPWSTFRPPSATDRRKRVGY
jgi:hypothetical protein